MKLLSGKYLKALVPLLLAGALAAAACAPAAPTAPAASPTVAPPTPTPQPAALAGSGLVKEKLAGEAQKLDGAGATFPAVIYTKLFDEYKKVTGVEVNYQAIGSGGGIKGIQDMTVDFGATDGFMNDTQLKDAKGGALLHIPVVMGAVVATYNIPELPSTGKALNFSPDTLAGIFLGTITKWNDPKIAADNAGVTLPAKDIVTVHRADGSGTTYIFTDYLANVSADWKTKVGFGNSVNWPGGLGAPGNAGVAGEIKNNPYSIGYVELIYAIQQKLGYANMKNKAGKYVTASLQAVSDAAANSKALPADMRASIVNADGDTSYPISGFTWQLVYQKLTDKAKATALTRLLWWETHDGQKFAADLGYAPLPDAIVKGSETLIKSITVDGTKAFPY